MTFANVRTLAVLSLLVSTVAGCAAPTDDDENLGERREAFGETQLPKGMKGARIVDFKNSSALETYYDYGASPFKELEVHCLKESTAFVFPGYLNGVTLAKTKEGNVIRVATYAGPFTDVTGQLGEVPPVGSLQPLNISHYQLRCKISWVAEKSPNPPGYGG